MPTTAPAPSVSPSTVAARAADRNWRANLAALSARQPDLANALAAREPAVTWALARDGSLSAKDVDGHWAAGCSVPLLAGRALLKSLAVEPGGQCFLAPAHAGLVVAARERLGPDPVLFVIQPDLAICRTILNCCDMSTDLHAGRLWFAGGDAWSTAFRQAFEFHPGLAAPARFIQTRLTSSQSVEPLIVEAQQVIGSIATARAVELDRLLRDRRPAEPGRTVIVAGSRFRLWSPGSESLHAALGGRVAAQYDTDDPLSAAPVALALATDGAAAVISVDLGRADAAPVVATEAKWITWLTRPVVPSADGAGPNDHLIVADPAWRDNAMKAGWAACRIHVGVCPSPQVPAAHASRLLGLIADTTPVAMPDAVHNFSSQLLLWEAVEAELHDDPLAVWDAAAYLVNRAKRMAVDPDELNGALFIDQLILPAYAQGLARLVISAGLPIRLWGQGWSEIPEFSPYAAGPITDADGLRAAVAATAAVVRHLPGSHWHPVEACGRPMLPTAGKTTAGWLSQAAALLRPSTPANTRRPLPTLADTLAKLLFDAHAA